MPSKDTLMLLEEQLTKLQTKYNEQQKVLADLPKFEREIKELELQFAKSLKLLPNNREIPSLLTNISTLAQESGLNILLFQPKPEVTKDFYAEIPVDMMVSGEYHNIGYFFDKISKLNRIVNISEIEINSDKKKIKNDKSNYLQSSFQAVTFKFVEKEKDSVINKKTKKPKSKR
jgi:type IV pilus assembly protein PilO